MLVLAEESYFLKYKINVRNPRKTIVEKRYSSGNDGDPQVINAVVESCASCVGFTAVEKLVLFVWILIASY